MKHITQSKLLCIAFVTIAIMIQSCSKDPHDFPNPFRQDKLLLSKVSGTVTSQDPNFWPVLFNTYYTYSWNMSPTILGANTGNFQINYSYGKNKNAWDECKPIMEETFINNGSYHFFYHNLLPYKVADSSLPATDLGYWQFYFNNKEQVKKVGLAFSQNIDPIQFELYNYDNKNRLDSFIYEFKPDNSEPAFKVVYQYNQDNDISGYQLYYIYPVSDAKMQDNNFVSKEVISSAKQEIYQRPSRELSLSANNKQHNISASLSAKVSGSFYEVLHLIATITTDGSKHNPFSQQGHIFFYQTNRYTSLADPTPFFLCLLKSNPIRIEYSVPSLGPDLSVQTFSYTYNPEGYPVTVHEELSDPDLFFPGSYMKDSQIEYIENY